MIILISQKPMPGTSLKARVKDRNRRLTPISKYAIRVLAQVQLSGNKEFGGLELHLEIVYLSVVPEFELNPLSRKRMQ
ncbi:hypothetical protein BHE74_00003199 [Ensete ventricosum]|nr:hypothetical protein BHE74_00003199 [Ensete ventricosum]RZR78967.1 hypothetical protein BHM03_00004529 [Ensete ventricosum]